MTLTATLYSYNRATKRFSLGRIATLRNTARRPVDVLIQELSATGFGMSTTVDFAIGSIVSLKIAGVTERKIRVVRRMGMIYGCEFLVPLSDADVSSASLASAVVSEKFGSEATEDGSIGVISEPNDYYKLPYLARAFIVIGTIIFLWGLIITILRMVLS